MQTNETVLTTQEIEDTLTRVPVQEGLKGEAVLRFLTDERPRIEQHFEAVRLRSEIDNAFDNLIA